MELISSDTSVWIDFMSISRVSLPFRLPYKYIMYYESMEQELVSPHGFKKELEDAGLVGVDISDDEFWIAESFGLKYPKLSIQDRIALAIAKNRKIVLLSGDKALRHAAEREGVAIMGTLKVLDLLYEGKLVPVEEYRYCLLELDNLNGGVVRLPAMEIRKRLAML